MTLFTKNKLVRASLFMLIFISWALFSSGLGSEQVVQAQQTDPVTPTVTPTVSAPDPIQDAVNFEIENHKQQDADYYFRIISIVQEESWAYANVARVSKLTDSILSSGGTVFVVERVEGERWVAYGPHQAEVFNAALDRVPDTLLSAFEKDILRVSPADLAMLPLTGYWLPWPANYSAYVTQNYNSHGTGQIDFSINSTDNIYTSKAGEIVYIQEGHHIRGCASSYARYNNVVVVKHAVNEYTLYLHLQQNSVPLALKQSYREKGIATVAAGTFIGREGNVGYTCGTTGKHLHFSTASSYYTSSSSDTHDEDGDGNRSELVYTAWTSGHHQVDFHEYTYEQLRFWASNVLVYSQNSGGGGCCGCAFAVRQPTNNQPQSEYSACLASQLSPEVKRSPHDRFLALYEVPYQSFPSAPSAEIEVDREGSAGVERTLPLSAPEVWCETHEASVWSSEPVVRLNLAGGRSEGADAGYAIVWDEMADTEPEAVVDPKELVDTSESHSPELATGEWYAHVRAIDGAGNPSTSGGETVHLGPFLIDVTPPEAPTAIKSESHTVNVWSSEGAIDVGWAASARSAQEEAAESGLAGYAYSWDQSPESEPEGHDLLPPNAMSLKEPALADGRWYFHLRALDQAGNASETVHLGPFLLDTTAPVLELASESTVLTNEPQLDAFSWAPASDEGEVKGYYVYWGEEDSGESDPSTLRQAQGAASSGHRRFVTETSFTPEETIAAGTATTRYLRLAALDAAGNLSAWQTAATWHYDNVPPTGSLTIAGGGETVRSLNVTLNLAAEDADSTLTQMRFSADGKQWSEWQPYTSRRFWQLQNQPQRQAVYAQVRDEAGNLSEPIQSSVVAELNVPAPASTNYQLARRAITMGGGQKTSNSYTVRGNSGQAHETGHLESNNYQVKSGFWAGIGRVTPTPTPIPTITRTPTITPTLTPTPTPTYTPTTDPNSPNLSIPSQIPALPATSVAVPITFTSHGATISSVLFSVDFDESCLAFDPTDSDADGIPDAINFNIPSTFQGGVSFDVNDSDGELDFSISDFFPPLAVLPDSTVVTITLTATCQPQEQSVVANVSFSTDPSASFGDSSGQSVPGTTTDGSVQISAGLPGNCNGDQVVDAGDISALVLEVFDGDGNQPIDAPGGTFLGDPSGCNANQDALIDAGDISCTVLLIFNGSGACTTGQQRPDGTGSNRAQNAPELSLGSKVPASDGERVTVPLNFTANGHQISTLVFSVDYEQNALSFDPTDSDGDGQPDAVTFNLPESFEGAVTFDPTDSESELDFFIADISLPLAELPEGPLAFITFEVLDPSKEGEINFSLHPATSFGNRSGQSVPGDGGSRDEKLYLPIILR